MQKIKNFISYVYGQISLSPWQVLFTDLFVFSIMAWVMITII